jgi:gliding motility-associated-like protein
VTDCPEICSEATISIEIAEADELEISDAISPNGDGKNETWIIPNLDQYPENKLMIMNRWGQVLYKAKPYLSDWEGTNENGERLPEGVYYYLLTLDKDGRNARKGMITIIR